MASSVLTAFTGNLPIEVSPASMMASTPSSTACAASVTSARVGRGASLIDSSTCVARITGTPRRRAAETIRFCTAGRVSIGNSTPRSPRATITASASARMSSIASTALGFSIFATMGSKGAPAAIAAARAARTSSADCTKLSAAKSTPIAIPARRSPRSFGVSAATGTRTPGRLMPLCASSMPPLTTRATTRLGVTLSTSSSIRPSSSRSFCPARGRREQPVEPARDSPAFTRAVALVDHQRLAVIQVERRSERPRPDLRAPEVLQNRHLAPGGRGRFPDPRARRHVVGGHAVGEIETERVRAGVDQLTNGRGVVRRRTERHENAGPALWVHDGHFRRAATDRRGLWESSARRRSRALR